jgi:hypothetical protein
MVCSTKIAAVSAVTSASKLCLQACVTYMILGQTMAISIFLDSSGSAVTDMSREVLSQGQVSDISLQIYTLLRYCAIEIRH